VRTRVLSTPSHGAVLRGKGPGWMRVWLWISTSGAMVVLTVVASWTAVLQTTSSPGLVVTPVVLGYDDAASDEATVVGDSWADGRSSRTRAPSPPTAGTTSPPVIEQGASTPTVPPSSATFVPPTLLPVRVPPVRVRPLFPSADEDDDEGDDEGEGEGEGEHEKGERVRDRAESDDDD
jgi:hypothetical protein